MLGNPQCIHARELHTLQVFWCTANLAYYEIKEGREIWQPEKVVYERTDAKNATLSKTPTIEIRYTLNCKATQELGGAGAAAVGASRKINMFVTGSNL
jgi:hypothetical protein